MMHQYRITKYDPKLRDSKGRYLDRDEWTSICDVGEKVSLEGYLKIEQVYVAFLSRIFKSVELKNFKIIELEDNRRLVPDIHRLGVSADDLELELTKESLVSKENIPNMIRLALRELIWMKLETPIGEFIHTGFEMYIYIGLNQKIDTNVMPKFDGIYLEEFNSPYL